MVLPPQASLNVTALLESAVLSSNADQSIPDSELLPSTRSDADVLPKAAVRSSDAEQSASDSESLSSDRSAVMRATASRLNAHLSHWHL